MVDVFNVTGRQRREGAVTSVELSTDIPHYIDYYWPASH
jgi:hypothetical protein